MSTQLECIYRDEKRIADFKVGFHHAMRAAAELLESWDGQQSEYRLGDILLCKFNMRKQKPRKTRIKAAH